MKFKFGLLPRVVLAIALGVACGFFLPGWATRIALTFNAIFGQFLGFAIPLLILGLVAPGIADLGRNAGRLLALTAALAEPADLLILDEAGSAWELDMVDKELLRRAVLERPAAQECVLTAHKAPQWMLDAADYSTEMKCCRHPYQKGIKARKGIEY